jgi:hypothetical protein
MAPHTSSSCRTGVVPNRDLAKPLCPLGRNPARSIIPIQGGMCTQSGFTSTRMRQDRDRAFRLLFVLLPLIAVVFVLSAGGAPQTGSNRKIKCKTPENAASCYWAHGRLSVSNGTPSVRLWKIGTKRILAIHSGPGFKIGDSRENENPELPANVDQAFKTVNTRIFADFEICPLEPEQAGVMQSACIESARKIVTGP